MSLPSSPHLLFRPRSLWNDWHYNLLDDAGSVIGGIELPLWAQAKNARLRWQAPEDAIAAQLTLRGQSTRIRFEYLSRGWVNDIRWTLESNDGEILACLDQSRPGKRALRSTRFFLTQPFSAELLAISGLWGNIRMDLKTPDGITAPCVSTPKLFSVRRELQVESPMMSDAVKAFVGFIALTFYTGD